MLGLQSISSSDLGSALTGRGIITVDESALGPVRQTVHGRYASPEAAEQVIDAVSMAVGREPKAGECELLHLINATPPLTYKENPLKCLRAVAERRQACMVTSYMMMGGTLPVTGAGTLIQGYAEVLAGLALTQLWSSGAPVVTGLFGIPFDMRSMLPCYGDPASHLVQIYAVQLARRLGVPVRGEGGVTSAKMDDGQAGSDGARATAASLLSGRFHPPRCRLARTGPVRLHGQVQA